MHYIRGGLLPQTKKITLPHDNQNKIVMVAQFSLKYIICNCHCFVIFMYYYIYQSRI